MSDSRSGYALPIAYFSELMPDQQHLRLAAAVTWRGVPTTFALAGGGGVHGVLRSARHYLWQRLGPLGADVSIAGRPLFGCATNAARGISSVLPAPKRKPLAYYEAGTRTLRIVGRVLLTPQSRTMVALVDATGPRSGEPLITLCEVSTPELPIPVFDTMTPAEPRIEEEVLDFSTSSVRAYVVGDEPRWEAALRTDVRIQQFLEQGRADFGVRAV